MKYAWINRHTSRCPIRLTCEVLSVSVSGYFAYRVAGQHSLARLS